MELYPILDFLGGPLLFGLFLFFLLLETWRPLRRRVQPRLERLLTNGALAATATLLLRLVLIPVVVWVAALAEREGWGLLHLVRLPAPVEWLAGLLLLDFTIWVWHYLNHVVPFLWRFHHVHHTDLDLDVSTAVRFHFGELLLSVGWRCGQVLLIGAAPLLVLAWEIVQEAATEFHHSNWRLPARLERALNWVVVTPRMHGIHHSIVERETNSNWGVIFSWWDRLLRTLRLDVPQDAITIGVPAYRDPSELTFLSLLRMPFCRQRPTWELPSGQRLERPAGCDSPPSRLQSS
ncbi:MAG: sterol desaturase family protein [Armatimonadota bacterium]